MPTEDAYSSGHLVLSHFGTCMCSNVETNLSWTCLVSGLLNFEYPSVLLFCLLCKLYCFKSSRTLIQHPLLNIATLLKVVGWGRGDVPNWTILRKYEASLYYLFYISWYKQIDFYIKKSIPFLDIRTSFFDLKKSISWYQKIDSWYQVIGLIFYIKKSDWFFFISAVFFHNKKMIFFISKIDFWYHEIQNTE